MSAIDQKFQELSFEIFRNGRLYENLNRGTSRLQIPSYTLRHKFSDGFPLLSLKQTPLKWIATELIWFLRGDNDIEFLNFHGVDIWNKDAYNWYKKKFKDSGETFMSLEEFSTIGKGSVGQNYSIQWRDFNGMTDQIQELVDGMRKDIMSSRLKVNAWNPSELDATALPPCHSEFQVVGVPLTIAERQKIAGDPLSVENMDALGIPKFGFELHWNQRSVDTYLGLPFNIASYALLAKILEAMTGYPAIAIEGTLKCVHFYDNGFEAAKEIMNRDVFSMENCQLETNFDGIDMQAKSVDDVFFALEPSMFKVINYFPQKNIKVEMLAPKEL